MKNLKTLLLLLVFFTAPTFAQQATPEQEAKAWTEKMQSQIGFSEATNAKVYSINLNFIEKAAPLKTSDSSKLEKLQTLKKLGGERNDALEKIFNKDEFAKFKEHQEENRKAFKEKYLESKG